MRVGAVLKKFYHCKLIPSENHSIKEYEAPIEKWGNYQPLSSYVDVMTYGKDIGKRWRLIVPYRGNEKEYSFGDLLYLDGENPPENTEEYGEGANATITAVNRGYIALVIEIESIIPR